MLLFQFSPFLLSFTCFCFLPPHAFKPVKKQELAIQPPLKWHNIHKEPYWLEKFKNSLFSESGDLGFQVCLTGLRTVKLDDDVLQFLSDRRQAWRTPRGQTLLQRPVVIKRTIIIDVLVITTVFSSVSLKGSVMKRSSVFVCLAVMGFIQTMICCHCVAFDII